MNKVIPVDDEGQVDGADPQQPRQKKKKRRRRVRTANDSFDTEGNRRYSAPASVLSASTEAAQDLHKANEAADQRRASLADLTRVFELRGKMMSGRDSDEDSPRMRRPKQFDPSSPVASTTFGDKYVNEPSAAEERCALFWCIHLPRVIVLGSVVAVAFGAITMATADSATDRQNGLGMMGGALAVWTGYVLVWGVPCRRRSAASDDGEGGGLAEAAYGSGAGGYGENAGFHGRTVRESAAWAARMRKYRTSKPPLGYL